MAQIAGYVKLCQISSSKSYMLKIYMFESSSTEGNIPQPGFIKKAPC